MLLPLHQELSWGAERVFFLSQQCFAGGPPVVSPSTAKVALLHLHQLLFAGLVTKANSILITEPATYV